jgi:hypothetical protein
MLLQNWREAVTVVWVLICLSLIVLAWTAPNSFISQVLVVFGMVLNIVVATDLTFYENLE